MVNKLAVGMVLVGMMATGTLRADIVRPYEVRQPTEAYCVTFSTLAPNVKIVFNQIFLSTVSWRADLLIQNESHAYPMWVSWEMCYDSLEIGAIHTRFMGHLNPNVWIKKKRVKP